MDNIKRKPIQPEVMPNANGKLGGIRNDGFKEAMEIHIFVRPKFKEVNGKMIADKAEISYDYSIAKNVNTYNLGKSIIDFGKSICGLHFSKDDKK